MTILNNGQEAKYIRPDTKAKDLERIADALEKLVELQTPKTVEVSNVSITSDAINNYDVANKIAKRGAEGNVQGFSPGGYTGYSKTQAKGFTTKLSEDIAKALKNEDEKAKDFLTKLSEEFAKPKDCRADTIELKREKNKLVVRIAEIEGELQRREEK